MCDNFPTLDRVLDEQFSDIQYTVEEVERHLKTLNVSKSPGPDSIQPRILNLKACASQLAPSLPNMFNNSFPSGTLPQDWKLTNITPIYTFMRENYRQVSFTSVISTIAENIVRDRSICRILA